MKVPFTYTTKIYKISLNILVVFIVLILVEKLSKDYNSIIQTNTNPAESLGLYKRFSWKKIINLICAV